MRKKIRQGRAPGFINPDTAHTTIPDRINSAWSNVFTAFML